MEEMRVSSDGYAYTRSQFLAHFRGLDEWNTAPVEMRYDHDGNTYTKAAFFAHYGGLKEWNNAAPANAIPQAGKVAVAYHSSSASSHSSSYSTLPAVTTVTPGWSSDRGPLAPDEGFFDTRGYQEQYHSYDDMAYSPQVYGHWSAAPASNDLGSISSRSEASGGSLDLSHTNVPGTETLGSSTSSSLQNNNNRRPGTSASVVRGRGPTLRGRHPMYRSGNSRQHAGLGGGLYASHVAPLSSIRNEQRGNNIYGHTAHSEVAPPRHHRVERSLSSLGRKLFSHIPPSKQQHFFPPDSPKNRNQSLIKRRKSAGEQLGALTPKNGHSPDKKSSGLENDSNRIDIGDYISVRCNKSGRYRLCRVLDLRDGEPPSVHVHFEGVPFVPDELICFDSDRLAPFDAQQSPANGPAASSRKITVAKSKKVSIGDYVEVRIFYHDASTKKGDFRWQMAQIISLDSNDGSIRVNFEGLSGSGMADEIIPGPDVPLRVRAMSTGIMSPSNSPKRSTEIKKVCDQAKHTGKSRRSNQNESEDEDDVDFGTNVKSSKGNSQGSSSEDSGSMDDCSVDEKTRNMRESKSDIAKELRKRGLRVIKIAADGNCLFRAVCHQVYGDVSRHLELRKQCCDYMASQCDHFSAFVEGKFDDYLDNMRDAKTWGGNLEIEAMQEIFDRKIQIHSNDSGGGKSKSLSERNKEGKPASSSASERVNTKGKGRQDSIRKPSSEKSVEALESGVKKKQDSSLPSVAGTSVLESSDTKMRARTRVPSVKIPVVLKHDFSSSSDSATPRPSSESVPDPIMLSYHGRSHYNSVVNPERPPPLKPLETSYIRQGRMLREQQAKRKPRVGGASDCSDTDDKKTVSITKKSHEKEDMTPNTKKKKKKANRLAFFRFRKSTSETSLADPAPLEIPNGGRNSQDAATDSLNESPPAQQQIKKHPVLEPIHSAPNLSTVASNSSNVNGTASGANQSKQETQRESGRVCLPSLQDGPTLDSTATNAQIDALHRADKVLAAASKHEKRLVSQGL